MTKILNFALKIKGVVGRVAHAKSSDPATPPKKIWNVHLYTGIRCFRAIRVPGNKYSCQIKANLKS